jgi:hypothetical protein
MTGMRNKQKLLSFLKQRECAGVEEDFDLDRIFTALDQDPELFHHDWLRSLLAEGLSLDRACEVILESVLRPN